MRPPLPTFLVHALGVAAALGVAEVAIRSSPLRGLGPVDVLGWIAISVGLSVLVALPTALVARVVKGEPFALYFGALVGLHASINYRFEVVLNEFMRDPKVWAGMPAVFLLGLGLGWAVERFVIRTPRRPWLWAVVAVAFLVGALVRSRTESGVTGDRPSVLVVSMDTCRQDRLSPYGHAISTPHIDKLAREGVTFDQAIANAPITEPSHLAMFTGVSPYRSGIVSNGTNLGERPALIWRTLRENGYLTSGFVSGFPLHSKYGWAQGMSVYDDDFGAAAGVQALSLVKLWNQFALKEHALRERPASQVLARALPWLRAHKDEQFFAFVHFYDIHGPYTDPANARLGPPPTDGTPLGLPPYWPEADQKITDVEWLKKAYDNEIVTVDDAIGQLVAALGDRADDTIIMITADHGESFTEHAYYFDHGDNLYDPSLKVPWIVRYPKAARAGHRVDCQVGGVDLAPTVLELVGLDDGQERDGRSRVNELGGGPCTEAPVASSTTAGRFVEVPPVAHSLRGGGEKLVLHEGEPTRFFDLKTDPGETTNLHPSDRSQQVEQVFRSMLDSGGKVVAAENDAATRAALEALGYLEEEGGGTP